MDWRSVGTTEEECRAPARAHGAQNGGGAPGPSTVEGEKLHVVPKNFKN